MKPEKIVIGSDHAGLSLKKNIMTHLSEIGVEFEDVGTYTSDSCDYPEYASALCKKIQNGEYELGILICGTGVGMSMAANKHNGIRAACCSDTFSAKMTRMHNNANVLCIGERVVGTGLAIELCDIFINTDYAGGRHEKRVQMLAEIEKKNGNHI